MIDHDEEPRRKWRAACAECAEAKAKCVHSIDTTGSQCDRCQRLGKDCSRRVFKARKKRQSKPSKILGIEKRLSVLATELRTLQVAKESYSAASSDVAGTSINPSCSYSRDVSLNAGHLDESKSRGDNILHPGPVSIPPSFLRCGPPHCICRPTPGEAPGPTADDETLLRIYRDELSPSYPFVVITTETNAAELEAHRPFLMASIRLVASYRSLKSMQGQLYQLMTYISERLFMQSERSLDLLAGIVVVLSWHNRHCIMHSQMQNLVSLASTLVGALGLKGPPTWSERTSLMVMSLSEPTQRTNEERRLLLAVWHLSSSISIGIQQIDPMQFSPYMSQCLQHLENCGDLDSDIYLGQLVRMQLFAEKIAKLRPEDASTVNNPAHISKAPISGYISAFRMELSLLCRNMPQSLIDNKIIQLLKAAINLRLHEPPSLDTVISTAALQTLTTSTHPSAGTPLDEFYGMHKALSEWYHAWIGIPVSSYHTLPMPVFMHDIYAVTLLGRWARLFGPQTRQRSTMQPEDPSGSYNNPKGHPEVQPDLDLALPNSSSKAVEALRQQLFRQPNLHLDVVHMLGVMADKLCQASDFFSSQTDTRDVWRLTAVKLRIAQYKLQKWLDPGEGVKAVGSTGSHQNQHQIGKTMAVSNISHTAEVMSGLRPPEADLSNFQTGSDLWMSDMPIDVASFFADNVDGDANAMMWDSTGWDDWLNAFQLDS